MIRQNIIAFLIFMGILLPSGPASAQWPGCMDVAQFVKEIDPTTNTWKDMLRIYKTYGCDDGVYAEGYSDHVTRSLAKHWDRLGELTSIIKKAPFFEDIVLQHIDATADPHNLKVILKNARTLCPPSNTNLCKKIEKTVMSILE
jgi:hypothetical protein